MIASEIPSQNVTEPNRHKCPYLSLVVCRFGSARELWAGWTGGPVSVAVCSSVPEDDAVWIVTGFVDSSQTQF